jgi:hypothetical protein
LFVLQTESSDFRDTAIERNSDLQRQVLDIEKIAVINKESEEAAKLFEEKHKTMT